MHLLALALTKMKMIGTTMLMASHIFVWNGGGIIDRVKFENSVDKVVKSFEFLGIDREGYKKLLIETAVYESTSGMIVKQSHGPALGIYQIEPRTHRYVTEEWLGRQGCAIRDNVARNVDMWKIKAPPGYDDTRWNLMYNINYQTAVALALYYKRTSKNDKYPLTTIRDRSRVYKRFYNTGSGKGSKIGYIQKAKEYWNVCEAVP